MAQYRATVGIDYPPNKRVEAGEIATDLPGDSIKWLLEQGLIESTDKKATVVEQVKVETVKETVVEEEIKEEEVIADVPASEEGEAE